MNGPAPALIRQPRPQSILLANELPLVQAGLIEICKSNLEYKVAGLVCDGGGAWRLIEERLPDIAVLDLRLSVRSGLEIVQRATQAKLSTKVIVLAANSDREMLTVCLHAGARAFLLESASSQELLGALRQVAEGGIYISKELNLLESLSRHRSTLRDAMSGLPRRQFQVLSLLVEGLPTKAIASRMKLSPATVAMHRAKLMRKLDIHTVAGLVKFVFDHKPQSLRNLTDMSLPSSSAKHPTRAEWRTELGIFGSTAWEKELSSEVAEEHNYPLDDSRGSESVVCVYSDLPSRDSDGAVVPPRFSATSFSLLNHEQLQFSLHW